MKYTSNKIPFGQVDSISFTIKQKPYSETQNTNVGFEVLMAEIMNSTVF
jgi:hypothetical protein